MGILNNAIKGTKDFTDTARLNALISDDTKQIQGIYTQIGKLFYETNVHDESTPIGKLCINIDMCNKRIEEHKKAILDIKGSKKCPNCGASINSTSAFCAKCGTKVEVATVQSTTAKKFCTACGGAVPENSSFCTSCGKQFTANAAPEKKFCNGCGEEMETGSTFCTSCGKKCD
ncbi:MAG: zinc ribbon domain-containing protein [Oscillospiraceae bacterium]|jgi:rRNA maturation endonuclease Nob1|nr:zinc ribbon domain-containing protein [Oscillospiraceae bacterium]